MDQLYPAGARARVLGQLVDLLLVDLLDALDRTLDGGRVLGLCGLFEVGQRGLDGLVFLARELLDPGVGLVAVGAVGPLDLAELAHAVVEDLLQLVGEGDELVGRLRRLFWIALTRSSSVAQSLSTFLP